MSESTESGFTLTEMLVALMVLGVAASAMSSSMGTAFKSYERLSAVSGDMQTERHLHSVFTDVSNSFWLDNGPEEQIVLAALDLPHPHFQKLEIAETEETWRLMATADGFEPLSVYRSNQPIRIVAVGTKPQYSSGRRAQYDYYSLKFQEQDREWKDVISVPLKVDADPECRFDIVGRRCR